MRALSLNSLFCSVRGGLTAMRPAATPVGLQKGEGRGQEKKRPTTSASRTAEGPGSSCLALSPEKVSQNGRIRHRLATLSPYKNGAGMAEEADAATF